MKIALVSPYDFAYPSGVGNHISCLEQQFSRLGHEVKIIAPASKAIYTLGDRFIRIGTPRPIPVSGSIARITLSLWLDHKIEEVFDREKFDICHLHEPLMPMLCTSILRIKKAPMVGTFHASGGRPWYIMFTPIGKWYLNRWFRKLDARITVSQVALDYVSKYFPADYKIIPNGVNTQHFHEKITSFENYNDGKTNIVFVGRLEKRKGFEYLLEAYRLLKPKVPNCRLIQVGPGVQLLKGYKKYIAQYGIPDVSFTGYASYVNLAKYYATADIVCFPNTGRESQGIVLLEAMATGKPIVASAIGGFLSVFSDGVEGIAVPPKDPAKIAEGILKLIKDKQLRQQMGKQGIQKAKQYDWTIIASKILDVYKSVLKNYKKSETKSS
jgi:phosphatidylinositol alpha-mannosyltransferase